MSEGTRGILTHKKVLAATLAAAVMAAGMFTVGVWMSPARAQTTPVGPLNQLGVPQNSPVLLEADSLTYDSRTETAIATGNATVYYGDYTIRADKITYDQKTDTVVAYGNVQVTEPDGAVVTADSLELSDELREGFIRSISVALANNARIAAVRGRRTGGNVTEFDDAIYTACKRCEDNPSAPLTWELKAVKIRHNQLEKTVEYEDVTLELFGQPVAYIPYFFHPDPTVKKKSGFLAPSFSASSFYGAGVRVPYFWNIAPNYDLTIQPLVTSKQGPLFDFKWRQRTEKGYYTIRPTFIWQADPPAEAPGNETFRGSISTEGRFDINSQWSWGWDATAVTDDTYLRRYGINGATDLTSTAYLKGISERNYFALQGYIFKGLLDGDTDNSSPEVLPLIDHNYIFDQSLWGGELALDTTVASLSRDQGADSTRLSTDLSWERQFVAPGGNVFRPFWNLRGDVYSVDNVPNAAAPGGVNGSDTVGRFLPAAGLEWRLPIVGDTNVGTFVFEPIAQIIARPSETGRDDIPNEDSVAFAFDASQLFDRNKFSGVDRYEGGTRANVGFRFTVSDVSGGFSEFTFGQSYQIAGTNSFDTRSGLEESRSDYVGSFFYRPNENLKIAARARLDKDNFELKATEVGVTANYEKVTASVSYANIEKEANPLEFSDRQEINFTTSVQVAERWKIFGNMSFDIENSDRLQEGIGIGYGDECLGFSLAYTQTHFEDRDIQPEQRIMLTFLLTTLGGTSFNSNIGSLGN
ncbi:LPS-assembly protein LptD @ Organic solvent tolerance protein precursor [hydrothermal vent metagenome]|uniref:LPS-assembly protein LptD @ Organic solvent tolerance protein n=1 Tax=hydrothermal vent metagenome TaxID=652676 RepID=A0A3B0T938_9ZZZZ